MKKIKEFFKKPVLLAVLLVLSVMGTILYYPARVNWVFVDIAVNIERFTFGLLYAMILNSIALSILLLMRLKNEAVHLKKSYFPYVAVEFGFTGILFVASLVFAFMLLKGEQAEVYLLYLQKSLFNAFFFIAVPFFALFFCFLNKKAKKCVLAGTLAVTTVIVSFAVLPLTPFKITSHPMVINTGEDYSVVFSTSDFGTGFVEYTYGGKDYKIYDENGGRLKSRSKIHSINVPFEHLENNTYKIGSQRVIEQYSYGSRTGKTIISEEYKFTPAKAENMTCLVITDWHTRLERVYDAVSYAGDYDAVILLGDSSPGVDFEEQVVKNIVEFGGEVSKGTKPVIYARGNHETRGEYAGEILDALGLDEFYYTADVGGVSFVVLDSGEDKIDTHPEYGGMTEYKKYREDMIEWLKTVDVKNEKVVALCHSWAISDIEKDLSITGWNELERLDTSLIMSGHLHECRFLGSGDEAEKEMVSLHPHIRGYIAGGDIDGKYVASVVTFGEKEITIKAIDNSGKTVFNENVQW